MIVSLIYSCPICRCSIDFLPLRTQLAIGLLWNFHLLLQKNIRTGLWPIDDKQCWASVRKIVIRSTSEKTRITKAAVAIFLSFSFLSSWKRYDMVRRLFFLEKWTRNCCEDNDKVDLGSSCIGISNMIWEAALLFFSECFFFLEHWRSWLYYEGKESKFLKIDIVAKCQFFRLPAERERNYYRTKNSGWNKHRL